MTDAAGWQLFVRTPTGKTVTLFPPSEDCLFYKAFAKAADDPPPDGQDP